MKHFLASKTIWVNALSLFCALGLVETDYIPAQYHAHLLAALAAANILLRFLTGQPISLTKTGGTP